MNNIFPQKMVQDVQLGAFSDDHLVRIPYEEVSMTFGKMHTTLVSEKNEIRWKGLRLKMSPFILTKNIDFRLDRHGNWISPIS